MFKIGTRVKKVRGIKNLGLTGVVVSVPTTWTLQEGYFVVRGDTSFTTLPNNAVKPAGAEAMWLASNWEPIIPTGHMASSYSLEQLLDKEMYRVKA